MEDLHHIRPATEDDLDAILSMVAHSIPLMREAGILQWHAEYPTRAHYAQDIAQGCLFVEQAGEAVTGAVCINREQPALYRTLAWNAQKPALVVHRFVTDPDRRRQGIARRLLEFALQRARQEGLFYLRTDTYSKNLPMQALFASCDLQRVGAYREEGYPDPYYGYDAVLL